MTVALPASLALNSAHRAMAAAGAAASSVRDYRSPRH
jgi:hypothetical protein